MLDKLSSDLIVDVMRSADPARQRAAVARLESIAVPQDRDFALALDTAAGTSTGPGVPASQSITLASRSSSQRAADATGAYQGFERMVLRNMFESMLPAEDSGAFGESPSASVWRSLAADQLAGIYAKTGGIGIAATLASAHQEKAPVQVMQWPYFSLAKISSFSG